MIPAPDTPPQAAPTTSATASTTFHKDAGGITLITCHANADFDAFAGMLAARFLYTPHVLLFPGSQERGLQKLYAALDAGTYNFSDSASLDWLGLDTDARMNMPSTASGNWAWRLSGDELTTELAARIAAQVEASGRD